MRRDKLPPDTTIPYEEEPPERWSSLDGDQMVLGVLNGRLRLVETRRGMDLYVESRERDKPRITDNFTRGMCAMRGIRAVEARRKLPSTFYPIPSYDQPQREFIASLAPGCWYEIKREDDAEFLIWHDIASKPTAKPKHEPMVERLIAEWRARQPKRPAPPRPVRGKRPRRALREP